MTPCRLTKRQADDIMIRAAFFTQTHNIGRKLTMRMRKKPWAKHELAVNTKIIHEPQSHKGKWQSYFGNTNPIHVELGCGKGRFIAQTSMLFPSVNHIAIERQEDVLAVAVRLADKMILARDTNPDIPADMAPAPSLAYINTDVKHLPEIFAPGEISRIYINFCDPWPNRKKWEKRRLTHIDFLGMYESLFDGSGEVFFKTDNRQLFEFSINQFSEKSWFIKNVSLDLHNSGWEGNIMTEYEEKFSSKGNPIYRLEGYSPHSPRIHMM